jgi:hypothetical protein
LSKSSSGADCPGELNSVLLGPATGCTYSPPKRRLCSQLAKKKEAVMEIFLDTANLDEIRQAARMGADIGAMPFKVFEMSFHQPLTGKGRAGFLKDWEKARQTLGDIMSPAAARQAGR